MAYKSGVEDPIITNNSKPLETFSFTRDDIKKLSREEALKILESQGGFGDENVPHTYYTEDVNTLLNSLKVGDVIMLHDGEWYCYTVVYIDGFYIDLVYMQATMITMVEYENNGERWQVASVKEVQTGGTKLYRHSVEIDDAANGHDFVFQFISNEASRLTLNKGFSSNDFVSVQFFSDDETQEEYFASKFSYYHSNRKLEISGYGVRGDAWENYTSFTISNSATLTDTVTEL